MAEGPGKGVTARTFHRRLRGLMFRRGWPEGWGALRFPDCAAVHTAFTFLRPDLLFLDRKDRILRVVPSAGPWRIFLGPPGTTTTVELPSGTARRRHLRRGGIYRS